MRCWKPRTPCVDHICQVFSRFLADRGGLQMRSRGSLRTAQSALRKAISKKESVGEAYRGFMSEVKEELEVWLIDALHFRSRRVVNRIRFIDLSDRFKSTSEPENRDDVQAMFYRYVVDVCVLVFIGRTKRVAVSQTCVQTPRIRISPCARFSGRS